MERGPCTPGPRATGSISTATATDSIRTCSLCRSQRNGATSTPTSSTSVAEQRERHAGLAELGVSTVFLSTPDLDGPHDVLDLAGLNA